MRSLLREKSQGGFINEIAPFMDMPVTRTGKRMVNQLILIFHHQRFNLSLFCKKLCTISKCGKIATEKCQGIFWELCFSRNGYQYNMIYGTKGQPKMYLGVVWMFLNRN